MINFLIWNYDKQAYNKVKIKNSLSKSSLKAGLLLIMFCSLSSTKLVFYNELPSVRHISYQHWLVAKETALPLWTSSYFPSAFLLKGGELVEQAQGQDAGAVEAIDPAY